jgi:hypothetical protein
MSSYNKRNVETTHYSIYLPSLLYGCLDGICTDRTLEQENITGQVKCAGINMNRINMLRALLTHSSLTVHNCSQCSAVMVCSTMASFNQLIRCYAVRTQVFTCRQQ